MIVRRWSFIAVGGAFHYKKGLSHEGFCHHAQSLGARRLLLVVARVAGIVKRVNKRLCADSSLP